MIKPKPPPPPQPRAGDVVVLRQSQEHVEGEIITVLGGGRYRVKWETGVDHRDRITTVTAEEIRKKLWFVRGSAARVAQLPKPRGGHAMPGIRQVEAMQGTHRSCTGKHRDRPVEPLAIPKKGR